MSEMTDAQGWARSETRRAEILRRKRKLKEAAQICSRVLQLDARSAEAWAVLGTVAIDRGDYENARRFLLEALKFNPNDAAVHHNLGTIFSFLGLRDKAEHHYREGIRGKPKFAEAYYNLSALIRPRENDPIFGEIERLFSMHPLSDSDKCFLHFAAAKLYDGISEYDTAFDHYVKANRYKRAIYDSIKIENLISENVRLFDRPFFESRRGQGSNSEYPIFVVGMPRSGTTLVEQILAGHPRVYGSGERTEINFLAKAIEEHSPNGVPYPACIGQLTPQSFVELADAYLKQARHDAPDAEHIVDKNPLNFRHLGLIALIFPRASIIHCRRNPLDTCVSCYFQNFVNGQEFSFDLTSLGKFYRCYHDLVEHWKSVCSVKFFEVQYEELVAEPERISRELTAFCGLDWDSACADFHTSERPVRTASLWQVRQPVYHSSVGRWRNYAKHLGPLIEALGPLAGEATGTPSTVENN